MEFIKVDNKSNDYDENEEVDELIEENKDEDISELQKENELLKLELDEAKTLKTVF